YKIGLTTMLASRADGRAAVAMKRVTGADIQLGGPTGRACPVPEDPTARVRRVWDKAAPGYDRAMRFFDRWQFGGGRQWVCSRASGETLEVAVGTGLNLPFYPAKVRLTGVDLSPAMLDLARGRAAEVGREIDLREADAQALPFPDASFDTVVCTLSLCTVPDERVAIGEMWRVLRPGGQLLLLDH